MGGSYKDSGCENLRISCQSFFNLGEKGTNIFGLVMIRDYFLIDQEILERFSSGLGFLKTKRCSCIIK